MSLYIEYTRNKNHFIHEFELLKKGELETTDSSKLVRILSKIFKFNESEINDIWFKNNILIDSETGKKRVFNRLDEIKFALQKAKCEDITVKIESNDGQIQDMPIKRMNLEKEEPKRDAKQDTVAEEPDEFEV